MLSIFFLQNRWPNRPTLKNAMHDIFSEGYAAHPVRYNSQLQIKWSLGTFLFNLNSLSWMWQRATDYIVHTYNGRLWRQIKKRAKQPLQSTSRLPHLTRSTRRTAWEGRRVLKAVKALCDLISRPILDLCFFETAFGTSIYRKQVVRKSR
jgi:hypothetical protein